MKNRRFTREQAEAAYSAQISGSTLNFETLGDSLVVGVRLPERPTPGGMRGRGFLPLTYECLVDGLTHTLITPDGPEVDELRAFLRTTVGDLAEDERVQFWFEDDVPFSA